MNDRSKQRAALGVAADSTADVSIPSPDMVRSGPSPGTGLHHIFEVEPSERLSRLDRFLAARVDAASGLSRTRLQALIGAGAVRVDGRVVQSANARLDAARQVSLEVPPPDMAGPSPQDIPLAVVFEDAHLLVLDKPAGLVVHPAAGHADGTLVNALLAHCGDSLSGIGGVRRPGIVHRLDKDTTGLMVVAKTDAAHRGLADIFADHGRSGSLERVYSAFVWGVPSARSGTVDLALGRHAHQREKMAVVPEARGRRAVTHWRLETTFEPLCSIVTCALETGRTHQIRVHMAELGHPLMGDPVYGTGFKTKAVKLASQARDALAALKRQALHAGVLGFEHPITGARLHFESPLPEDLGRLQAALARAD